MAKSNSPLGQFASSIPAGGDTPDVRGDLAIIVGLIEPFVNMRYTTRLGRDNAISAAGVTLVDGMLSVITGTVREVDLRLNSTWVKIYPLIYSGTTVPSNSVGIPGDIYVRYA